MGALKLTYYEAKNPLKVVYNKTLLERKSVQRFLSVDPLASKYPSLSPYNYCANNPVMLVDPDGRDIETDIKTYGIIEKGLVATLKDKNPFSFNSGKMEVGEFNRKDFDNKQLEIIDKFKALIDDKSSIVKVMSEDQFKNIPELGTSLWEHQGGAAGVTIPYSSKNEIVSQSVYIATNPQFREKENGETTIKNEKHWYSALTAIHEIAGHCYENRFNSSASANQKNTNVESFENRVRTIFFNNGAPIKGFTPKHDKK